MRTHYGSGDLVRRVERALAEAGLSPGMIPWDRLAPLDQFHTGGLAMTRRLAAGLELAAGTRVLDVGSGLGGPARFLAATYGCVVTGVDRTDEFVETARLLSERTGLASRTVFEPGDALALPFRAGGFDRVLLQHVAMNIADRPRLYAELHRVLRPGGLLALHDVTQGGRGPLRYPLPWAARAGDSYVLTPEETRSAVTRAGFSEVRFADVTAETIALLGGAAPRAGDLSLGVVMGPRFREMAANLRENLEEGRARVVQVVLRREDGGTER